MRASGKVAHGVLANDDLVATTAYLKLRGRGTHRQQGAHGRRGGAWQARAMGCSMIWPISYTKLARIDLTR